MLRILLPPNLATAAPRDAIAVKVELDASRAPLPAVVPALAVLHRLCGGAATLPPCLQLTRAQLRELVTALKCQAVFFNTTAPTTPLLWIGPRLRTVSEHLDVPFDPNAPKPASAASSANRGGYTPPPPSGSSASGSSATSGYNRTPSLGSLSAGASSGSSSGSGAAAAAASRLSGSTSSSPAPRPSSTPLSVDGSEHFLALSLPSRENSSYAAALDLVKSHGFALDPSTRKWWLRDRHKVLNFLANNLPLLRDTLHADFTENFDKNTAKLNEADITCDIAETSGEFTLTLGLQAGKVSEEQLRSALATSRGYVEDNGKVYLLPPEKIARLAVAQRALAGSANAAATARRTWRIPSARVPEVQEVIDELVPHFQPPAGWKARGEALKNLSKLAPAPITDGVSALLRPYQQIGVAWLWHLHRHGLGGILADEMGLGKTLQAISLLTAIQGEKRPSLVICPASLVENWRRETERFAPHLRVFIHHGTQRLKDIAHASAHDLVITSYGTLARDRDRFADFEFSVLIADEAQHIKNKRTQNAQALRSLNTKSRFLLTGTPVENSLDDLRALFDLLMPGYLEKIPTGTRGEERGWFDDRLRAKTAPYILRRTKKVVATELPDKIEQVLYCEPTSAQAALYADWQKKSEQELDALAADGASENSMRLATLTQLLRLRQICCDPRLVAPATSADHSSKLETFRELLAESIDDGHRLLVFSQFTSLLGLLRAELEEQGLSYCYLDGSTPQKQRQGEVDRYNNSPDIPVFLISLKAGGTGLNLTGADTVVHFDPWWNPAAEAQATDRAHRIGQKRVVTSYKLICTGTVEEKVLHMQETKRALLADVFEASDAASSKLSLTDMRSLLQG